jgi:hypothetical protein
MHIGNVRRLQDPFSFEGAEYGFALAGYLNLFARTKTPAGLELVRLICDFQRLMSIWPATLPNTDPTPDEMAKLDRAIAELRLGRRKAMDVIFSDNRRKMAEAKMLLRRVGTGSRNLEENKLIRRIDARLKKLFRTPTFMGFKTDGGRKRTDFMRLPKLRHQRAMRVHHRMAEDLLAFQAEPLERLSELGLIDRIRECPTCGRWLFARFERERFCSGPCREKAFRASAEGKEKRRKYMQSYRARLKRMEQNYLKTSSKARR